MKSLLLLSALVLLQQLEATAQRDSSDQYIYKTVKSIGVKIETDRAVFWFGHTAIDQEKAKAFANDVTEGIKAVEKFTGTNYDVAFYGTCKIEYIISDFTTASHVYNGYHHNEKKSAPVIFFSAKRFERNALPYLHETTHLILREFHSLWLREGMAEWIAKQVAKQLGKGHVAFYGDDKHTDVHQLAANIQQHEAKEIVLRTVGMNGIPSFKNSETRRLFYIGSTSLVEYLSMLLTKEKLLGLYEAADTTSVLEQLLGKRMEDIEAGWLQFIERSIAISGE